MCSKITFTLALLLFAFLALTPTSNARSIEAPETQDLQETQHPLVRKKRNFSVACKGIYDIEIFAKLDNACMDCQNVYRMDTSIQGRCSSNCFGNPVFKSCVKHLHLNVKRYLNYAQLLRDG